VPYLCALRASVSKDGASSAGQTLPVHPPNQTNPAVPSPIAGRVFFIGKPSWAMYARPPMMPPAQCPQCAAPLPPAATRCGYCGLLTPWGATAAAVEQRAAGVQAEQARKQRIAKAESTARTGMLLALVGLPICCAPLSIVGGVMGAKGGSMAKAEGLPRPVTSVIAMIIAFVTTLAFTGTMILYHRDQKAKDDRLAEVRARLEGKREAEALPAKVACDVIEEHLVKTGHAGKQFGLDQVHCDGALTVTERRAQLADVRFSYNGADHFIVTACLERRSRWFVLKLLDAGTCADLPPPFTPPGRKLSEDEAAADEVKARGDLEKLASAGIVKAFTDKLARVKAHAAAQPGAERPCSKADLAPYVKGSDRRKVAAVDLDLLDAGRSGAPKEWPFLTSDAVRKVLDDKRTAEDRAKAIDELRAQSGPLLVVYRAEQKDWPVVSAKSGVFAKDFSYEGGEFAGWLFVYDVDAAERKCQTKLIFESSSEVNFRKSRLSSEKKKAKEAVEEDFKDHFETAATEAIKRAAPDLRLGYKVIE
jgi:hypothetical protein